MAVFRFRLATLLNVKEQLEKSEKNALGLATVKMVAEKQALQNIHDEQDGLQAVFFAAVSGVIQSGEIKTIKNRIGAVKLQEAFQQEKVKEAAQTVDKIRDRVVVLMQERKVLEKLKEKAFEEFRLETLSEEQRLADELVTYRSSLKLEEGKAR